MQLEVKDWPTDFPETAGLVYPRLNGHRPEWISAIAKGLGHKGMLLTVLNHKQVTGLLPLTLIEGPIFGRFLVSLPYINTGGVCADDPSSAKLLIDGACNLADKLNVRYLELRHESPIEHASLNFQRVDKVHMRLDLPDSDERLEKSFKSKLRSQIKKSKQHGLIVAWGSTELLDDFYRVFSINMRDLGTPVFSKKLFHAVISEAKENVEVCVVYADRKAVAAAILVHHNKVTEVPSASSLRRFNHLSTNMFMYRHLLSRAIERGSHTFDFGRSSIDSGTYKFKAQWGANAYPATWQYYVRQGTVDAMLPNSKRNQRLVNTWKRLPVWLTRIAGPPIVRGIP